MPEVDFEAGGLPSSSDDAQWLEESAADVASIVGAAAAVGALGTGVIQAYYARATHRLQRDAAEAYDPGFADKSAYEPGFDGQDEYDPGFSDQVDPVLDLTFDDPSQGLGGQEYYPGFEDLDY